MGKRVISSIISFSLVLSLSANVFADTITDTKEDINQQKSEYSEVDNSLDSNQLDIDKLEQTMQNLSKNITDLSNKISAAESKISTKEKAIDKSQNEIDKLEKDINDKRALLDDRVRAMYISGNDTYISFVLDSADFSDLISRMEFVKKIVSFDKDAISELNSDRKQVDEKIKVLEKDKKALVNLKSDLEKDQTELVPKKKDQEKALNVLNSKKAALEAQRSQYAGKINAAEDKLANILKAQAAAEKAKAEAAAKAKAKALEQSKTQTKPDTESNSSASRGEASDNTSSEGISGAVLYASKFLGDPYVWGATGQVLTRSLLDWARDQGHYSPSQEQYVGKSQAFDCSGLVVYVFAHYGIKLPRTTYYQVNVGKSVSKNNLKSGDLIFYGSSRNVYHVAIYIGDGMMIEAPYTGGYVRISPAFRGDYYTARRVM